MMRNPPRQLKPASVAALIVTGLLCLTGPVTSQSKPPLSKQAQAELDAIDARLTAAERTTDTRRASARQIASEIEKLREQIVAISRQQGASEKRSAIYRAKLETLNQMEADLTRRLGAVRAKQSRLLSALQLYSRNPPPAIFVSSRRANDAVVAAIIMKEITPELKLRAAKLSEQNKTLINVRRAAALQSEALFVSESDVSEQQAKIEALIAEKYDLEDQLLREADAAERQAMLLKSQSDRLRGNLPLKGLLGATKDTRLKAPLLGRKVGDFGVDGSRGLTLESAPGAQVTAPSNGTVEYAGPLDTYGQVVIVRTGADERIVLTGLGRVYVDAGQTVIAGEPVGRMPNLSSKKTELYLELRRGEVPVNPNARFDLAAS
ncbi:peptidoglycan DD-metalloendopeptidase family protein [Asticcacaulis sp. ZE23SCel15]|uniref:murein hydrolase activator EnvC family protein n=1 Tax=Asticcacaulis sp. ZE23SCel15 TaxID=3059027 RepID=UPI00265F3A45|nr:peptidoglycan DD-metalloendopeptidase family protein [Asticcacaulis sp. ZE23SCel15]WKL58151.1 peptidoglycan DD-metalloendopeptidase family protein [Asticcacaulis sp. ZE23SCel15]